MFDNRLLVESLLPCSPLVVVGDPALITAGDCDLGDQPFVLGDWLTLQPADPDRRGFVWVAGTSRVRDISLQFDPDDLPRPVALLGYLECRSGRLVVGSPEAVAAWGPRVEADHGLLAQARAYGPGRHHRGLVVVAEVGVGEYPVLGVVGDGGVEAVVIDVSTEQLLLAG